MTKEAEQRKKDNRPPILNEDQMLELAKQYQDNDIKGRDELILGKAGFPLGEFVRANREKSNLIGWRQTLTTLPTNHIRFLLVRANKFAKWKTGLRYIIYT